MDFYKLSKLNTQILHMYANKLKHQVILYQKFNIRIKS